LIGCAFLVLLGVGCVLQGEYLIFNQLDTLQAPFSSPQDKTAAHATAFVPACQQD
jgi:hypothetical protein